VLEKGRSFGLNQDAMVNHRQDHGSSRLNATNKSNSMQYQSVHVVDSQNINKLTDNAKAADLDSELENGKTIQ
jgi:hypothetical protein